MPFTRAQYDALIESIAAGTTAVSYSGKSVTYRSLDDMIKLAKIMQRSLGIRKGVNAVNLEVQRKPSSATQRI